MADDGKPETRVTPRGTNGGTPTLTLRERLAALFTGPGHAQARPTPDTTEPMGRWTLRGLMAYLLLLGALGTWVAWSLWTAEPPEAPAITVPALGDASQDTVPVIVAVEPAELTYGVGRPVIRVFGHNFDAAAVVHLDGRPHPGSRWVDANQMVVVLDAVDFREPGAAAVTVASGDRSSTAGSVRIVSSTSIKVRWDPPFLGPMNISVEARLALLVLLVGALGGTLASFYSLSNYRGEGKLVKSWYLHYWLSPLLGCGVAFFLYVVVRAGFLAGSNIELDGSTTPWGLVAVSGLAGLFYDKTLLKLREVFVTLFDPKDTRSGKLKEQTEAGSGGLAIGTTEIPDATAGRAFRYTLEASGGKPPYSWEVHPDLPGGLLLDPLTGVISGTPTEPTGSLDYEFSVRDLDRASAGATLKFGVK